MDNVLSPLRRLAQTRTYTYNYSVSDAKRLIGRPWSDASIQADKKHWPFEVFESRGVPRIKVNVANYKETFAPEEASASVENSNFNHLAAG